MEYLEIERHEMKPDIYGGKNMDEHIPMWIVMFMATWAMIRVLIH